MRLNQIRSLSIVTLQVNWLPATKSILNRIVFSLKTKETNSKMQLMKTFWERTIKWILTMEIWKSPRILSSIMMNSTKKKSLTLKCKTKEGKRTWKKLRIERKATWLGWISIISIASPAKANRSDNSAIVSQAYS